MMGVIPLFTGGYLSAQDQSHANLPTEATPGDGKASDRVVAAASKDPASTAQVKSSAQDGLKQRLPVKDADDPRSASESPIDQKKLRLREGTRLREIAGRFRPNGDTLIFIDEQRREIGGLPNLNLERIIRVLKTVEEPESIVWSVSGADTEFSGRNYLLISRAVYKTATPPPAPEALAK
jgi:hypothetical protein